MQEEIFQQQTAGPYVNSLPPNAAFDIWDRWESEYDPYEYPIRPRKQQDWDDDDKPF